MMLEVLVASSAWAFSCGSRRRVQRLLGLEVLEDGLDDHVGSGNAGAVDVRPQARERGGALGRVAQALVEQLAPRA